MTIPRAPSYLRHEKPFKTKVLGGLGGLSTYVNNPNTTYYFGNWSPRESCRAQQHFWPNGCIAEILELCQKTCYAVRRLG